MNYKMEMDYFGMEISVAICTRDRAPSLERALQSLVQLHVPPGTNWKLLIIDNGSTDGTAALVTSFRDRLPVRHIFEPVAGLSNARNRAVDEARGTYIIWTDDDVVVEPDWLAAYAEAFKKYPDAAVFGGKILPVLDPPTPAWFAEARPLLDYVLAHRDFGDVEAPLSVAEDRLPFGANYAVRTKEQREARYDPGLGVGSAQSRVGEETTVINSILSDGRTGRYVPKSKVNHHISQSRQTVSYIFRYYRAHGETAALVEGSGTSKLIFSVPRWLWRRMILRYLRYHRDRLTAPPQQWVQSLIRYAYDRGAFQYWRNRAYSPKRR